MVFEGRDVKTETLDSRRKLLDQRIVPKLTEPVRYVGTLDASLRDLVHSVKAQGLRAWSQSAATADTSQVCARAPG